MFGFWNLDSFWLRATSDIQLANAPPAEASLFRTLGLQISFGCITVFPRQSFFCCPCGASRSHPSGRRANQRPPPSGAIAAIAQIQILIIKVYVFGYFLSYTYISFSFKIILSIGYVQSSRRISNSGQKSYDVRLVQRL